MSGGLPPPPTRAEVGDFVWVAWYNQLNNYLSAGGSIDWTVINKAGSSIADLQNKSHDLLTGVQGGTTGEQYHLTNTQYSSIVYNNGIPRDLGLLQYNAANARWESDSVAWVDIDFPILIRTTGANIPSLTTLNGNITMPQWSVNDFNVCEAQELIHGWKEGSTIYWHLHLTTNGLEAVDKFVRFELEYGYVAVGGAWVFPATVTTADLTIPANTASKTMLIMSLASFTVPSLKIGGHVVARLKRVTSVGAAPTTDPWIPMLQMHVQLDTIGSRSIGTK